MREPTKYELRLLKSHLADMVELWLAHEDTPGIECGCPDCYAASASGRKAVAEFCEAIGLPITRAAEYVPSHINDYDISLWIEGQVD